MTTFDPNSITPSDDFMRGLINKTNYRDACVLSARWGAEQAVYALKHQWPEPLMRPVTKEDGDKNGFVQVWFETDGSCFYNLCHWEDVKGRLWLHTPSWQPKPELTLKQQARSILYDADISITARSFSNAKIEISREQLNILRDAVALLLEKNDGAL
jgi:hypothetical protein